MSSRLGISTQNTSLAASMAASKEPWMWPAVTAYSLRSRSSTVWMEKMGFSTISLRASTMSSCTGLPSRAREWEAGRRAYW